MASKLVYQHPADDLAKLFAGTLVDGTLEAGYSLDWLWNDNLPMVVRFSTNHLRIVWDLTMARAVELPVLFPANLAGDDLIVTFEANSVNSWPGDIVTAMPTIVTRGNGFQTHPFLDRTALATRRFVSLNIVDNDDDIVLRGVWVGAVLRQVLHNVSWGVSTPRGRRTTSDVTNAGVEHIDIKEVTAGIRGGRISTTRDVGMPALQDWGDACDWRAKPVPVIFEPDATVKHAQFVRWDQDELDPTHESIANAIVQVSWRDTVVGEAFL